LRVTTETEPAESGANGVLVTGDDQRPVLTEVRERELSDPPSNADESDVRGDEVEPGGLERDPSRVHRR